MERIANYQGLFKHRKFLDWFDNLMIDANLLVSGHQPRASITMDRLNEGTRLANELMGCREPDSLF